MADANLPCARCGRLVLVPLDTPPGRVICARCSAGSVRYIVHRAGGTRELDADGVLAALRKGELSGLDAVARVGEAARPLAGHPDFRVWFMPGAGGLPGTEARPTTIHGPRRTVNWGEVFKALAATIVGGAAVGAVALFFQRGPSVEEVGQSVRTRVAPVLTGEKPAGSTPPAKAVDPASQPPIAALLARVGPVDEPRALTIARARALEAAGDPASLLQAVGQAERAVARDPTAVDALSLLAELEAEADQEPELRTALLTVARSRRPESVVVRRAAAADALARGQRGEAASQIEACRKADPDDVLCRFSDLRLRAAIDGAAVLPKFDALTKEWPENRRVPRAAALLAAELDQADATARLDAVRPALKGDVAVDGAYALLRLRDGKLDEGCTLADKVGDRAGLTLAVVAAEASIVRKAPQDALTWLDRAKARTPTGEWADRVRVADVQARWMLAKRDPARVAEASSAASALTVATPAAAQARMLVAALSDKADAGAWGDVDEAHASRVDLGRAWMTRARLALEHTDVATAQTATEKARTADPHVSEPYLLAARAMLVGANPDKAVVVLRQGVLALDGRGARRGGAGGALPVPVEAGDVRTGLEQGLTGRTGAEAALRFAKAAAALLGGDAKTALGEYPEPAEADASGYALVARARLAVGDVQGARTLLATARGKYPTEPALAALEVEAALLVKDPKAGSAAIATLLGTAPDDAYYHALRAALAQLSGDSALARSEAETAHTGDPSDLVSRRLWLTLAGGR